MNQAGLAPCRRHARAIMPAAGVDVLVESAPLVPLACTQLSKEIQVLNAALYERFSSRSGADFANRVLSAMREQFGGHDEKKIRKKLR